MKNRISSSPILSAVVLSLVVQPSLSADLQAPAQSDSIPPSAATYTVPPPATATTTPTTAVAPATNPAPAPLPAHTATYTVVKGDSLTRLAVKFKTTRKKLEELNNLTASKITPGQVLLVPSYKKSKSAGVAKAAKPHHTYPMAQPVQDFDIPASTFASCPVPLPSEENDEPAPATEKPAPIAQLVSPSELAADMAKMQAENDALAAEKHHQTSTSTPYGNAPSGLNSGNGSPIKHSAGGLAATSQKPAGFSQSQNSSSYRTANRSNGYNQPINSPTDDWGTRFLQQARALGNLNLEYDEDWRPPGESHAWTMDCSNTSRYLYKVTTGIELPRTASDQYYYLHLQGKAWDVPQNSQGWADGNYLRQNLKPGDLLFWENTYRPERQPPITHVMVFLGTNAQGQWLMAGSQSSRGGEHNRRNGGPDIYIFRPSQPCGGYTTWLGMVHHQGRFCAFGRPLEADPSKLSVAADD